MGLEFAKPVWKLRGKASNCMLRLDLTGQKFGRYTVYSFAEIRNNKAYWNCICEWGAVRQVRGTSLTTGKTKSCGCLRRDMLIERNTTHGKAPRGSRLFNIWHCMRTRCNNPNHSYYDGYGGRGIHVCDEWDSNYEAFYDWAMTHGYADDLTLDRIDVNGNYEPQNCRWATWEMQNNNKRNSKGV